ncbi:hypothetical protein [Halorientalis litorea]|jgi:chemotaxis protein CheC|uniref:hypothetical protein n=1 Tax=Halorientalis litorea TaxID=2931977 RepID=UPI001FF4925F|nr:hypothetical protein [Halorientalis litorea]
MMEKEQESRPEGFDMANRRFPIGKLSVMNRLAELGTNSAADRLQQVNATNGVVETDPVQVGYATDAALTQSFGTGERTGARIQIREVPHGYVLVLFPLRAANNAAALMLSNTVDDVSEVSGEMARSALTELSGILANGYFDVWANRFGEEIVVSEPSAVQNTEREIVQQVVNTSDDVGLYLRSRLRVPASGVTANVYLFPETETFLQLTERVNPSMLE